MPALLVLVERKPTFKFQVGRVALGRNPQPQPQHSQFALPKFRLPPWGVHLACPGLTKRMYQNQAHVLYLSATDSRSSAYGALPAVPQPRISVYDRRQMTEHFCACIGDCAGLTYCTRLKLIPTCNPPCAICQSGQNQKERQRGDHTSACRCTTPELTHQAL